MQMFAKDKSHHLLLQLTWQNISVLKAVNTGLKPEAKYSLSAHLEGVMEESEQIAQVTANLKYSILEQMECIYGNDVTQMMIRKTTLLDPRY